MSRSKSSRKPPRAVPPVKDIRTRSRRRILMLAFGAVIIVAALYWGWASPYSYYVRARSQLSQHPSQCERLADQAIMKAGGNYPEAQLLQCRAFAAMEEWDAALGGFSLIKDTTRCSSEALLDLGAKALEAQQLQLADRAFQAARVQARSSS